MVKMGSKESLLQPSISSFVWQTCKRAADIGVEFLLLLLAELGAWTQMARCTIRKCQNGWHRVDKLSAKFVEPCTQPIKIKQLRIPLCFDLCLLPRRERRQRDSKAR